MYSISAGTPGSKHNTQPASSIIIPGAVPRGLPSTREPAGTRAWPTLTSGIFMPRRANRRSISFSVG